MTQSASHVAWFQKLGIRAACALCGKEFSPLTRRHKYCSAQCHSRAADKRRRPRAIIRHREYMRRRRASVLELYGGRCECCGETRYEFLAIDHTNGGGTRERGSHGTSGCHEVIGKLWRAKERLPGYRVLCHNCNMAMGFYGNCPHSTERSNEAIAA